MPKLKKAPWRPQAILAIDPAKMAGVAVVDRYGKVLAHAPAAGDRFSTLAPAVLAAWSKSRLSVPISEVLFVAEAGWLSGRSMKGSLTLAIRRGLAQAAAEALGISRFEWVHPSTWQNKLFGPLKGRDTKALSMQYAANVLGEMPATDDVADAICIGLFAYREFCVPI